MQTGSYALHLWCASAPTHLTAQGTTYDVGGHLREGPPKSHQYRDVPIVDLLVPILTARTHECDKDELVFPRGHGTPWRNNNFRRDSNWRKATANVGLESFRIHDYAEVGISTICRTPPPA